MKRTLLLLTIILILMSGCRKESPDNTNSQKNVYLKHWINAEGGEYLKIEPVYNSSNTAIGFNLYNYPNQNIQEYLEHMLTASWNADGTVWTIESVLQSFGKLVYTIPRAAPNTLEINRMPTNIKWYDNGRLKWDIDIQSPIGQSFCSKISYKYLGDPTTTNDDFIESFDNSINGNIMQTICSISQQGGPFINDYRQTYTLGNTPNKTFNTCRELFWLLLAFRPDDGEDSGISPYWQALWLPTSSKTENWITNSWQQPIVETPYYNYTFSTQFQGYLTRMELANNNVDEIYKEWEWESR